MVVCVMDVLESSREETVNVFFRAFLAGAVGIEPTTFGFGDRRSTD